MSTFHKKAKQFLVLTHTKLNLAKGSSQISLCFRYFDFTVHFQFEVQNSDKGTVEKEYESTSTTIVAGTLVVQKDRWVGQFSMAGH